MEGTYLRKFPTVVSGEGSEAMDPLDISIDGEGHLWVIGETDTSEIIVSETGQYQLSLGGEGRISMPVGIYVDSSGNILVADEYDSSVEMFTDSGEHVRRVEPGVMFTGMALAPGGQLVLVNQMYSNVTILSRY
ncbi:NHL-repeat-containing protein 4-like [Branchiostoma floridae x Branchiostoma japonicum]